MRETLGEYTCLEIWMLRGPRRSPRDRRALPVMTNIEGLLRAGLQVQTVIIGTKIETIDQLTEADDYASGR